MSKHIYMHICAYMQEEWVESTPQEQCDYW